MMMMMMIFLMSVTNKEEYYEFVYQLGEHKGEGGFPLPPSP
jgi:hypothetical protein